MLTVAVEFTQEVPISVHYGLQWGSGLHHCVLGQRSQMCFLFNVTRFMFVFHVLCSVFRLFRLYSQTCFLSPLALISLLVCVVGKQ